jgi:hypothetical protein
MEDFERMLRRDEVLMRRAAQANPKTILRMQARLRSARLLKEFTAG